MKDERRPAKNAVAANFRPQASNTGGAEEARERIQAVLAELDTFHDVASTILKGALELGARAPMRTTPLQVWTTALYDLLADARWQLSDDAYSWFIAIGTERIGLEAARLAVGEALRATRIDDGIQEAA